MKPSYDLAHAAAVLLFLLNVAIGAIQGAYAAGHGADLGITPGEQAWIAIISTVIAAALSFLPALQRTPGKREARYLAATQGKLPDDIRERYPMVISVGEPTVTPSTPTSVHTEGPDPPTIRD